ncbi:MAG: hypothetical protein ACO3O3_12715 [Ilumatobacteraceae bacterium]
MSEEIATGPKYTHDCDNCRFCGEYDGRDLWVCESGHEIRTVILRHGDDGPAYNSMPMSTFLSLEEQMKIKAEAGMEPDFHLACDLAFWEGAFKQTEVSDE